MVPAHPTDWALVVCSNGCLGTSVIVQLYAEQKRQYACLEKLWTRESNWKANAYNHQKVMGRNAYGIPQILGLERGTHPTEQIDRGLEYIIHRYGTPCMAWKFHQRKGWY